MRTTEYAAHYCVSPVLSQPVQYTLLFHYLYCITEFGAYIGDLRVVLGIITFKSIISTVVQLNWSETYAITLVLSLY
jgi:hypothetical protein